LVLAYESPRTLRHYFDCFPHLYIHDSSASTIQVPLCCPVCQGKPKTRCFPGRNVCLGYKYVITAFYSTIIINCQPRYGASREDVIEQDGDLNAFHRIHGNSAYGFSPFPGQADFQFVSSCGLLGTRCWRRKSVALVWCDSGRAFRVETINPRQSTRLAAAGLACDYCAPAQCVTVLRM
jgi:hypothetical protein